MKKIFSFISITTLLLVFSISLVHAEDASSTSETRGNAAEKRAELQERKEKLETQRAEVREKIEANKTRNCELITKRIELVTTRYNNNKERHVSNYNKAKEKIQDIIDNLKSDGYDTSKLETDITELESLITAFSAAYEQMISDLNSTKDYACGDSDGAFRDSLKTSRDQSASVRSAALDIRNFYQKTIRPDLIDIKNQKNTDDQNEN